MEGNPVQKRKSERLVCQNLQRKKLKESIEPTVTVSEMKTFAGVNSRTLTAKLITFKTIGAEICIWHSWSQGMYFVSKPAIIKILSPHNIRKLCQIKLPSALQQKFQREAMEAYGINIQSSFYEVNVKLLCLLRDVKMYKSIANAISNLITP